MNFQNKNIQNIQNIENKLNNIHSTIKKKLYNFYNHNIIPNLIFNGPNGCGKFTIVQEFIHLIYHYDKELIKNNVLYINCSHTKGIKFIREELIYFSKLNTFLKNNIYNYNFIKIIVLSNADKLTIDAQCALRRCIEIYSKNTRYFFITTEKHKILKPLLSRFSEINLFYELFNNENINSLNMIKQDTEQYMKQNMNQDMNKNIVDNIYNNSVNLVKKKVSVNEYILSKINNNKWNKKKMYNLYKSILNILNTSKINKINVIFKTSFIFYEKGYSGLDIIKLVEKDLFVQDNSKYKILFIFEKIKKIIIDEKLIIFFILYIIYVFYHNEHKHDDDMNIFYNLDLLI